MIPSVDTVFEKLPPRNTAIESAINRSKTFPRRVGEHDFTRRAFVKRRGRKRVNTTAPFASLICVDRDATLLDDHLLPRRHRDPRMTGGDGEFRRKGSADWLFALLELTVSSEF
jgi:hypothetical protein